MMSDGIGTNDTRRVRAFLGVTLAAGLILLCSGCAGVRSASTVASAAAGRRPTAAEVRLVVTRDFGAKVLLDTVAPATKKLTVMRLLVEHATVDTGYGGQFVSGIDGVKSTFGAVSSADAADWFYWVDGMMADVGADGWRLHGGETVWWDYHRWAGSMYIPVSLDAFPAPFEGRVALAGRSPFFASVTEWARDQGLHVGDASSPGSATAGGQGIDLVRASPTELPPADVIVAADPAAVSRMSWLAAALGRGPANGVFVRVHDGEIVPLAAGGAAGPQAAGAALAVPNPASPDHQVLVLLASDAESLDALLGSLTPETLAHRVAVYLPSGAASVSALPRAEAP
jgi:hypothetical protein